MKYPDFIEQLILEKDYTQLSAEERGQVAEWVSTEAEYNNIRNLLVNLERVIDTSDTILPSNDVKQQLVQAFARKHGKQPKRGFTVLKKYTTPLSIAASLVVIAVVTGVLLTRPAPTIVAEHKTEPSPVETPIVTPKTNESPAPKVQEVAPVTASTIDNPAPQVLIENTPEAQVQNVTVAHNADLVNMTVVVF